MNKKDENLSNNKNLKDTKKDVKKNINKTSKSNNKDVEIILNRSVNDSKNNGNSNTNNSTMDNKKKDVTVRVTKKSHKKGKVSYGRVTVFMLVLIIVAVVIIKLLITGIDYLRYNFTMPTLNADVISIKDYELQPLTNYGIYKQIPTVRGVYLSEYTMSSNTQVEKWIKVCKEKEVNAVVINVKNDDGKISFNMDYDVADEIGAETGAIKDPAELVLKLKQAGIFPIARIVAFKDPYLASHRPDLAIKDQSGNVLRVKSGNNYEAWVNPYNKEVWNYIVEISKRAADVGFKEIQYDYIRFATGPQMKQAQFGELAKTKTSRDIVLEFSAYAKEELEKYGVYVSADVFGTIITSDLDASIVGQNYLEMAKIFDFICPMIYPSHYANGSLGVTYPDLDPYETIKRALVASNNVLDQIPEGEHRAIVRAWLQDFTATWVTPHQTYGAKQLREQKQGVYDADLNEWILWNSSNKYSIDGLENK